MKLSSLSLEVEQCFDLKRNTVKNITCKFKVNTNKFSITQRKQKRGNAITCNMAVAWFKLSWL